MIYALRSTPILEGSIRLFSSFIILPILDIKLIIAILLVFLFIFQKGTILEIKDLAVKLNSPNIHL